MRYEELLCCSTEGCVNPGVQRARDDKTVERDIHGGTMTRLEPIQQACGHCGALWQGVALLSTNGMGSDLDTRPVGMARETLDYQVRRCSACGYCARELSQSPSAAARQRLDEADYMAQLNDPAYPRLANAFLCQALLHQSDGQPGATLTALLNATWVCDDAQADEAARICRSRAIALLGRPDVPDTEFFPGPAGEGAGQRDLLLSDLLRRAGRFVECQSAIEHVLALAQHPFIRGLLRFEQHLIVAGETGARRIADGAAFET